jgi:hypothetical protein
VRRDNLAKTIASLERRVSVLLELMERADDWRPATHMVGAATPNKRPSPEDKPLRATKKAARV